MLVCESLGVCVDLGDTIRIITPTSTANFVLVFALRIRIARTYFHNIRIERMLSCKGEIFH